VSRHLAARAFIILVVVATADDAVAQAVQTRWAFSSAACSGEAFTRDQTPLIVEGLTLRWFNADCKVVSNYKVKNTLYLQAQCVSEGKTATIPVMLEPTDTVLRLGWNREPVREMRSCRWTAELGYH
jgi:hypothetical protein